jgi:phenylalanine-4-hydroxylase
MAVPSHIPGHLRQYVVEQDYEQYSEVDHAVWRFVLLQTHARLQHTAHRAYKTGLAATGISVERIPRIEEMNEKLDRFGWAAVCVDGFIPPRAFQAFQANRILPIAADIRTPAHLAYTPAPDIIHEAAGHAPILSEPSYARYVEQIGRAAEKAFASPADRAVYRAIYLLSEIKERPGSAPEEVATTEEGLASALAALGAPSESARLSRLYWWTAEYGLIGEPNDYRLYGAGLLSSLGESHSCHDPSVQKIPLSAACIETDYDITRAQPQLFVARDFEHLEEALDEVASTLAYRRGGEYALRLALESEEVATIEVDTGVEVVGTLGRVQRGETVDWVQFSGPSGVYSEGLPFGDATPPNEFILPFGVTEDGVALSALTPEVLSRHIGPSGTLELRLRSGLVIRGCIAGAKQREGRFVLLELLRFELETPARGVYRSQAKYPLVLAASATTVCAGAPDAFHPDTAPSRVRVPKPRFWSRSDWKLLALYERAVRAWRATRGEGLVVEFERIANVLDDAYPDEWLLRWNLLESLVKADGEPALARRLVCDLERLEVRFGGLEPIATGLEYLRAAAPARRSLASAG